MIRDSVKLLLIVPLLACMAAFAMGFRNRFKWAKSASEGTELREQFIFYWVMMVLSWLGMAAIGLLMKWLSD